jgi:hypothetical protein
MKELLKLAFLVTITVSIFDVKGDPSSVIIRGCNDDGKCVHIKVKQKDLENPDAAQQISQFLVRELGS